MEVTHYDVVEGRIGIALLLAFLGFAVLAHLTGGPTQPTGQFAMAASQPVANPSVLFALGGAAMFMFQNGIVGLAQKLDDNADDSSEAEAEVETA